MRMALAIKTGLRPTLSDSAPQQGTASTMAIRPIVFDQSACEGESPPNFWVKVEQPLPTDAGMHRVNWDLRYDPPPAFTHSFDINANPGLTPASPEGALVPPGTYTVRLTANGKTQSERVVVTNDPRSPASVAAAATFFGVAVAVTLVVHRLTGGAW